MNRTEKEQLVEQLHQHTTRNTQIRMMLMKRLIPCLALALSGALMLPAAQAGRDFHGECEYVAHGL